MGYWSDKCFTCWFTAAIIAIVALTTKTIVKDKKDKRKYKTEEVKKK